MICLLGFWYVSGGRIGCATDSVFAGFGVCGIADFWLVLVLVCCSCMMLICVFGFDCVMFLLVAVIWRFEEGWLWWVGLLLMVWGCGVLCTDGLLGFACRGRLGCSVTGCCIALCFDFAR